MVVNVAVSQGSVLGPILILNWVRCVAVQEEAE